MKLLKRVTLKNLENYNDVISLGGNLLLTYRIDHSERQTHMCLINERTKKIIKKLMIPITFQTVYAKKQNIFFIHQTQLYKIENLSGIPQVKQIKSIINQSQSLNSSADMAEPNSKFTVNSNLNSKQTLNISKGNLNEPQNFKEATQRILSQDCDQIQNQLLLITTQKYLITTFKYSNQISLLNYQGNLINQIQIHNIKYGIDHLLPLENQEDKILIITQNKFFIILDLISQSIIKKIKIPFNIAEGQSESVKITHVQKNEYLINYFEKLQVLDFDETKIKSKIFIDSNHHNSIHQNIKEKIKPFNSIQIDSKADSQSESPRMFVQNMIKISNSTFIGQYTLQYQGDKQQNQKYCKLNTLMMFNPNHLSNFLQLSFYTSV
ncbi:hypothetical protein ABPG72_018198 [Tetrahymena utriculariae]